MNETDLSSFLRRRKSMFSFKKFTALATAAILLSTNISALSAQEYVYTGGNGYIEYRSVPSITPKVALTAVALAAIIVVALQNSNEHGHSH